MKLTEHPSNVWKEWHPHNPPIDGFTHASNKKMKWVCKNSHEWEATVNSRTQGRGCPHCPRPPQKGRSIADKAKDIIDEWHSSNPPPEEVSAGSHKKYLWVCRECKYEWKASPANRVKRQSGCPRCAGKVVERGVNDLATTHPYLVSEWDDERDISEFTHGSALSAKWKCDSGHKWTAIIANRVRGAGCRECYKVRVRGVRKVHVSLADVRPDIHAQSVLKEDVSVSSGEKIEWECDSGHRWFARVSDRTRPDGRATGCPSCSNVGRSVAEEEVAEYVESLGFDVVRNDRSVIFPKELDIYIPEKNIAVEYNGLYWHTERRVGQGLHYSKYRACKEAGIQLIAIWEDDWILKQDIVKKMIAAKLGINNGSIGARKTKVVDLNYTQAEYFLDKYHIQGPARGTHYKGLTHDDELIAVAVFRDVSGRVYLDRYASSMTVSGGLDKMMKSLPYKEFITFADHSVSNGKLYEATGWEFDKELRPDYSYIYGGVRHHKFKFRKERFKNDPELLFGPGLTESQLAELNDLERVYDYGKTRYVKRFE